MRVKKSEVKGKQTTKPSKTRQVKKFTKAVKKAAAKMQRETAKVTEMFTEKATDDALVILPLDTFTPASEQAGKDWDKFVTANSDGYGACCVRYAARWAKLMEEKLAKGEKIEDVADKTSHEADTEGITGFMYGCAVSMLSQCWKHGEALRKWSNLKIQLKDEGERANEKPGAVLNPALLNVGV